MEMFLIKFISFSYYFIILTNGNTIINHNKNYSSIKICDKNSALTCKRIPKHYDEMGCTPIYNEGQCCPSRFECPYFALDKCHYKGNTYKIGDFIENTSDCFANCRCMKSDSIENGTEIICANVECPDLFDEDLGNCIHRYKNLDNCCPNNYICDEHEIYQLEKCYSEGNQYRYGEIIYPLNSCHKCLCNNEFNNNTLFMKNSTCMPIDCGMMLHSDEKMKMGCIPIYWNDITCCPIAWKCPSINDKIEKSIERDILNLNDRNMQCIFGKNILEIGDRLQSSSDKCLICTCETPPMAHCIRTNNC